MGTNKFVLIPLFCSIFIQLLTFHDFLLYIPAAQFCQKSLRLARSPMSLEI